MSAVVEITCMYSVQICCSASSSFIGSAETIALLLGFAEVNRFLSVYMWLGTLWLMFFVAEETTELRRCGGECIC